MFSDFTALKPRQFRKFSGLDRSDAVALKDELSAKLSEVYAKIADDPTNIELIRLVDVLDADLGAVNTYIHLEYYRYTTVESIDRRIECIEDDLQRIRNEYAEVEDAVNSLGLTDSCREDHLFYATGRLEYELEVMQILRKNVLKTRNRKQR